MISTAKSRTWQTKVVADQGRGNRSRGNRDHSNQSRGKQSCGNRARGNQSHGNQSCGNRGRGNQSRGNQSCGSPLCGSLQGLYRRKNRELSAEIRCGCSGLQMPLLGIRRPLLKRQQWTGASKKPKLEPKLFVESNLFDFLFFFAGFGMSWHFLACFGIVG